VCAQGARESTDTNGETEVLCGCHEEFGKNSKKYQRPAPDFDYTEVDAVSLLRVIYEDTDTPLSR
jgi:hypothetical protein